MSVGYNTVNTGLKSSVFKVKNLRATKAINVFNLKIGPLQEYNLMTLSYISEADIRNSLLKGDLFNKLNNGDLVVIESNIDLLQYDPEQKHFLDDSGVEFGTLPEPVESQSQLFFLDSLSGNSAKLFQLPLNEEGTRLKSIRFSAALPANSGESVNIRFYVYRNDGGFSYGQITDSYLYDSTAIFSTSIDISDKIRNFQFKKNDLIAISMLYTAGGTPFPVRAVNCSFTTTNAKIESEQPTSKNIVTTSSSNIWPPTPLDIF